MGDDSSQIRQKPHFIYWLVLACLLLFFREFNKPDLWASHEARAAQNAQSLIDTGSWLIPQLFDGTLEYQKPPGYYWLVALLGLLNGSEVNIVCVRLPAVLAATATVFLLWNYLRKRISIHGATLLALMLATSVHFTGMARVGRIDMPLTFLVTAFLLQVRQNASGWILALLVSGIVFLKGPIGLVLVGGVIVGCWMFKIELASRKKIVLASMVGLVLPILWFIMVHLRTEGEFTQTFFIYHHLKRAAGGAEALEQHPFWWYVPLFISRFLPYSPLVVWTMIRCRKEPHPETRFGLIWFVAMVLLLSLSSFKRADYLLPAFPGAVLILTGPIERWIDRYFLQIDSNNPNGNERRYWLLVGTWVGLLALGWVWFDRQVTYPKAEAHEVREFAKMVREKIPQGEKVIFFQVENHLLAYHVGAPIRTVVEIGEIQKHRPNYFVLPEGVFAEVALIWGLERITGTQDFLTVKAHHPVVLAYWKSE